MIKRPCQHCRTLRWVALWLSAVVLLLLLMASQADAQIYHYVDQHGRKVFVDRLSQIPAQYRSQVKEQHPADHVSNTSRTPESLRDFSTTLDLREQRRRIQRSLKTLQTPVTIANNQVLVPVRVTYQGQRVNVTMLMDTGATGTVFHRSALAKLASPSKQAGYARVAGGGVIKISQVKLDQIQIGPFNVRNIQAMVMEDKGAASRHDGLLGMDFLMKVDYALDKENQRLIWMPERFKKLTERLAQLSAK